MENDVSLDLAIYQYPDIELSNTLIQELFNEGERLFGSQYNKSSEDYYNSEKPVRPKPKISEKFYTLTLDQNPSIYYFAFYDDRRSIYYAQNTRGRSACLSTEQKKYNSNKKLREVIYSEENSDFFVTISESINNIAFIEAEEKDEQDLIQSNGMMKVKYRLVNNRKKFIELKADRMDEVYLNSQNGYQPARWTSKLGVDGLNQEISYYELFIINRSKNALQEQRVHINYRLNGTIENPNQIIISVGIGSPDSAKIIFQDKEINLRFEVFEGNENELEILRQDNNYAFLFEDKPDNQKVIGIIKNKIKLLIQHWDQPQSIFINPNSLKDSEIQDNQDSL